ncbi:MAG: retropepsin-like aspartic protease [Bryobacteraceae bacterium]
MIRLWYSLLVLCFLAAAEPPRTFRFELYANAIWFAGRVNGSAPLHILFDTAAAGCVLNRSKLDALKLPALSEWDQANAGAGDNPTRITLIPSVRIEFGGITLQPAHTVAVPLDDVADRYGTAMDGIVGFEPLERYVVRIDYDARTLTLYDPKEYRYDGGGAARPAGAGAFARSDIAGILGGELLRRGGETLRVVLRTRQLL